MSNFFFRVEYNNSSVTTWTDLGESYCSIEEAAKTVLDEQGHLQTRYRVYRCEKVLADSGMVEP